VTDTGDADQVIIPGDTVHLRDAFEIEDFLTGGRNPPTLGVDGNYCGYHAQLLLIRDYSPTGCRQPRSVG